MLPRNARPSKSNLNKNMRFPLARGVINHEGSTTPRTRALGPESPWHFFFLFPCLLPAPSSGLDSFFSSWYGLRPRSLSRTSYIAPSTVLFFAFKTSLRSSKVTFLSSYPFCGLDYPLLPPFPPHHFSVSRAASSLPIPPCLPSPPLPTKP